MASLCETYWPPLYAYIRHQGSEPEDARDLTQAYFAELLEKDFLGDVDASKGRFRSFLLSSLRNFLSHERERARALKRGGGAITIPLDLERVEQRHASRPPSVMTPEDAFEYRWAMEVLDRAIERLRQSSAAAGNATRFEHLRQFLTSTGAQASYRGVAETLGASEGAVKTAVHRLRKQFGECLRAEVADTVVDPAQIDDELQHLLTVVRAGVG